MFAADRSGARAPPTRILSSRSCRILRAEVRTSERSSGETLDGDDASIISRSKEIEAKEKLAHMFLRHSISASPERRGVIRQFFVAIVVGGSPSPSWRVETERQRVNIQDQGRWLEWARLREATDGRRRSSGRAADREWQRRRRFRSSRSRLETRYGRNYFDISVRRISLKVADPRPLRRRPATSSNTLLLSSHRRLNGSDYFRPNGKAP